MHIKIALLREVNIFCLFISHGLKNKKEFTITKNNNALRDLQANNPTTIRIKDILVNNLFCINK